MEEEHEHTHGCFYVSGEQRAVRQTKAFSTQLIYEVRSESSSHHFHRSKNTALLTVSPASTHQWQEAAAGEERALSFLRRKPDVILRYTYAAYPGQLTHVWV